MAITGAQCRAARGLLDWDQKRVGAEANVAPRTVVDLERMARTPLPQTLEAIRRAFEAGGVVFIDENGGGRGVRFGVPTEEAVAGDETGGAVEGDVTP